jgi:leucyl-tRNA synthetase
VNGKTRSTLAGLPAGVGEERVKEMALADQKVKAAIGGNGIRRVIYVPGRLINIVV